MSNGLSYISFVYDSQDVIFYGVLKPGVTQDQIFGILQFEPSNYSTVCEPLLDLLDTDYTFSSEIDFVSSSQSENCGTIYDIYFDTKVCTVTSINGGAGGISADDWGDSNCSIVDYYIPDYKVSALYGSSAFSPDSFLSKVFVPVSSFVLSNAVVLSFLAVTFFALGARIIRRFIGSFGLGR